MIIKSKKSIVAVIFVILVFLYFVINPGVVYASLCVSQPPIEVLRFRIMFVVFIIVFVVLIALLRFLILLVLKRKDDGIRRNIIKRIKKWLIFLVLLLVVHLLSNNLFSYVVYNYVDKNSPILEGHTIPCNDDEQNYIL